MKQYWRVVPVPGSGDCCEVASVDAFLEIVDGTRPPVIPYTIAYHLHPHDAEAIANALNAAEVDPRVVAEVDDTHVATYLRRECPFCKRSERRLTNGD